LGLRRIFTAASDDQEESYEPHAWTIARPHGSMHGMRAGFLAAGVCFVVLGGMGACGGNSQKLFDADSGDDPFINDSGDNGDGTTLGEAGIADTGPADVIPPEVAVVYGHSPTILYKLDPKTKAVTTVVTFDCTSTVIA